MMDGCSGRIQMNSASDIVQVVKPLGLCVEPSNKVALELLLAVSNRCTGIHSGQGSSSTHSLVFERRTFAFAAVSRRLPPSGLA